MNDTTPKTTFREFRALVREDWEVSERDWTRPGFRAVAVYRFGVWQKGVRTPVVRSILARLYLCLYRFVRNQYGIELWRTTRVGRRLLIVHQGGIVIHPFAQIGDDCLIRQNASLGAASHDRFLEAPKLEDGVQVGCGAAILGNITIGEGSRIGPNAVVMTDIPANASVFAGASRVVVIPQPKESRADPSSKEGQAAADISR